MTFGRFVYTDTDRFRSQTTLRNVVMIEAEVTHSDPAIDFATATATATATAVAIVKLPMSCKQKGNITIGGWKNGIVV